MSVATEADTENTLIKAGGYCRISSDPKDKRHGVTRQREDVAVLAEIKNWQIVDWYEDNDRSASSGKDRPEWDRLLADIKAGRIDAIAAWDQDRGWRMMSELEQLRRFFADLGRRIPLATTGQGDIDLTTPAGVLTAQVKTAVSEHEINMLRVRQLRAARQKAEQGRPQWRYATGYIGDTRQPDPVFAAKIADVYRLVLAGGSLKDGCKILNDAELFRQTVRRPLDPITGEKTTVIEHRPWTPAALGAFLRKPRNAGLRDHNDVLVLDRDGAPVKGTWDPLVDEELWRGVQDIMERRRTGRRSYQKHLLSGVLGCGKCGHHLSAQHTTKGTIQYQCKKCFGVGIAAEHVEPLVLGVVGGRLAKDDAKDLLHAQHHDTAEAERIREQVRTLNERLAGLGRDHGNGLLTALQVKEATDVINEQLAKIEDDRRDRDRVRVFDGLRLGTPAAVEDVKLLTPDRLRAVIDVIAEFTVQPAGKGVGTGKGIYGREFNPERVKVEWR